MSYFDDHEDEIIYGRCHDDDDDDGAVECKQCGKGGLSWEDDNGRCVLIDGHGKIHKCDEKRLHKAAADDFEVLE